MYSMSYKKITYNQVCNLQKNCILYNFEFDYNNVNEVQKKLVIIDKCAMLL